MIAYPVTRVRQAFALTLMLVTIALVWAILVRPVIDLAATRQAEIEDLTNRVAQLRLIEAHAPILSQRADLAARDLATLNVFWSGESEAAVGAAIQDLIRNSAQQSGGIVSSSSVLRNDEVNAHGMLLVRARVDGSLGTLQHVLTAIETATPKLFIDNLVISAVAGSSRDRPQTLSFEFSVSGYLAGGQHAH